MTSEISNLVEEINLKPQLVSFLVNGVLFELNEELIQKRASNSILAREDRRAQFYDIDKNVYVFDQPSDVFEVLVYFISTGLLSRPTNINNLKLYSLLSFFEMDKTVINTFKKMEHLVFEINWEKTQCSTNSWLYTFFALPFTSRAKLINIFFFAMTMISYGNLCFEYTFALPLFQLIPSPTDNTTMILTIIGLDFNPSIEYLSYLPEIIYLIILLMEFFIRFIYVSNKLKYFSNYLTIIDLLSILSCIIYLCSIIKIKENNIIIRLIICFRLIRILKLTRYSMYIRQYIQTIFYYYDISILFFIIFICLCIFFGNLTYGISLIDHHRIHLTPLDSLYYSYETILTIGFGEHIPSTPYLTWIIITSILFGTICLSLPVPFLAIYNFNLDHYEQEKIMLN
ncbi:unnamed protein product [Rotaria sordida]|uniref:Potassium channel n=2 Tax=Rotaria sordida TaxID=392033 RepID=A0A819N5H9_9BILA|nr:unnamed protein product [Rotaria sordida]CAF3991094.1 unnamed protein product [Rotaria sordida]